MMMQYTNCVGKTGKVQTVKLPLCKYKFDYMSYVEWHICENGLPGMQFVSD